MFRPKYISFDCYGTMINYIMGPTAREIFADRVDASQMNAFLESFRGYRLDECLGAWKPLYDVVANSIERTCRKHGVPFETREQTLIDEVTIPGSIGCERDAVHPVLGDDSAPENVVEIGDQHLARRRGLH